MIQMTDLTAKAASYLQQLCLAIPTRRVGSQGNRAATDFFADRMERFGYQIDCPTFDCIDWRQAGVELAIGDTSWEALPSPYTLGGAVRGSLVEVTTIEELATAVLRDKILLLRGDIAGEQLMPKNFPFYNPDHHRQIIGLLESKQPLAIIAATTTDAALAGAVSPFPLIEDGDFDIPSVYMTEAEGQRLSRYVGRELALTIRAQRIPATGCNVIARQGNDFRRRVVLCAHIDAKDGTPGAIDNGTGITILLLLAELLAGYSGQTGLEIVALNGEDYYAASGEKLYLARNEGRFDEILLGINLDGVGYYQGRTVYSLYGCPAPMERLIQEQFAPQPGIVAGEQWYQSDHTLFVLNQRPALAMTSERMAELWTVIAHTPQDSPEIVAHARLVEVAVALRDLVWRLDRLDDHDGD